MQPGDYYGNQDVDQMQAAMAQEAQAGSVPPDVMGYYGNMSVAQMQAGIYDQQAAMTAARVGYGNTAAYIGGGFGSVGAVGAGAYSGIQNMFGSLGSLVRPVTYTPPARMATGYYGQYVQQTGFFRSGMTTLGLVDMPRGVLAYDYGRQAASDFGERVGSGVVGAGIMAGGLAIGGLASHAFGSGVGGFIGSAVGSVFGPLGTVAGGAIGSLAGSLGGYLLGTEAANYINGGLSDRRQINNFLESTSFRYIGAGSPLADPRTGAGMSAYARFHATNAIRDIDFKDPTLNTQDLGGILDESTRLGLLTGVNDMSDFKKKFSDLVSGVKSVSKLLNTTLADGLAVIKDLKGIGIDPGSAREVAMQATAVGRVTGRTAQEVFGVGMQGAELFRGTGVQMGIGFQSNIMNLSSIRAARDAGMLSQEAIAQAGGEEALAQRMTASSLQFAQTAVGRGFAGAFFNPNAPGGFDASAFQSSILGGSNSYADMAVRAAQNLGTPGNVIKYDANMEKFMSELGKQFGDQGLFILQNKEAMTRAKFLVDSGATSNMEDALRYAFRDQGLSAAQIEANMARIKDPNAGFEAQAAAIRATRDKMRIEEAHSNAPFFRMFDSAKDSVRRFADENFARPGDRILTNIQQGTLNFYDREVNGIIRADLAGMGSDIFAPSTRDVDVGTDLDIGASILNTSLGERIAQHAKKGGVLSKVFGVRARSIDESQVTDDMTVIDKGFFGSRTVVDRAALNKALQSTRVLSMGVDKARELQAAGKLAAAPDLYGSMVNGKIKAGSSVDHLAQTLYGKWARDLNEGEYGALLVEAQKFPELAATLNEAREGAIAIEGIREGFDASAGARAQETIDGVMRRVGSKIAYDFSPQAFKLLTEARAVRSSNPALATQLEGQALAAQRQVDPYASTSFIMQSMRKYVDRSEFAGEFDLAAGAYRDAAAIQIRRGQAVLADGLAFDSVNLSPAEQALARGVIDKISKGGVGALSELGDEEVAALKKSGAGQAILRQRAISSEIDSVAKRAEKLSPDKQRELFMTQMGGRFQGEKLNRLADTFVTRGAGAASQAAFDSFTKGLAGDTVASTPSAGLRETEKGTAEETARTQMNINLQVLAALTALKDALQNRRP